MLKLVGPIGTERAKVHSRLEISTVEIPTVAPMVSTVGPMVSTVRSDSEYFYARNKNFDFALHRREGAVFGKEKQSPSNGYATSP